MFNSRNLLFKYVREEYSLKELIVNNLKRDSKLVRRSIRKAKEPCIVLVKKILQLKILISELSKKPLLEELQENQVIKSLIDLIKDLDTRFTFKEQYYTIVKIVFENI